MAQTNSAPAKSQSNTGVRDGTWKSVDDISCPWRVVRSAIISRRAAWTRLSHTLASFSLVGLLAALLVVGVGTAFADAVDSDGIGGTGVRSDDVVPGDVRSGHVRSGDAKPGRGSSARPGGDDDGIGGTGIGNTGTRHESGDDGIGGTGIGGTGIGPVAEGSIGVVGVITKLGSIIVNGLHVEVAPDAIVRLNEGLIEPSQHPRVLVVGQLVEFVAEPTEGGLVTRAVQAVDAVVGPVEAYDGVALTMRVAGQVISGVVTPHMPGQWVRVSGLRRADGTIDATRVQPARPQSRAFVSGVVSLTSNGNARLGNLLIGNGPSIVGRRVWLSGRPAELQSLARAVGDTGPSSEAGSIGSARLARAPGITVAARPALPFPARVATLRIQAFGTQRAGGAKLLGYDIDVPQGTDLSKPITVSVTRAVRTSSPTTLIRNPLTARTLTSPPPTSIDAGPEPAPGISTIPAPPKGIPSPTDALERQRALREAAIAERLRRARLLRLRRERLRDAIREREAAEVIPSRTRD